LFELPQDFTRRTSGGKAKLKPAAKVVADDWNFLSPPQNLDQTNSATTLAAGFNFSAPNELDFYEKKT